MEEKKAPKVIRTAPVKTASVGKPVFKSGGKEVEKKP